MEQNFDELLVRLQAANPDERYDLVKQIGDLRDRRALDVLLDGMNDENAKVRYVALSGLVKLGNPDAAYPVIRHLLANLNSQLWHLLKLDLGMRLRNGLFQWVALTEDHVATMLKTAFHNPELDEGQRAFVVRLIGRTGDAELADTFLAMLHNGSDLMRASTAEALGYLKHLPALEYMKAQVHHEESAMREIMMRSMVLMGGDGVGDVLLPMLESEDEWTRRASIVSLAELGDRRAVRKIMRMQREDESNLVRQVADEALKKLILSGH